MIDALEKEVYDGFAIGFNEDYLNPNLERWARQGILLINSALSTIVGKTNQHQELWAPFISYVFQVLRKYNTGIIYILLGSEAKKWRPAIDEKNNYVLTVSHPASVKYKDKNVWDSEGIFLKTNQILEQNNGPEAKIIW
jgi:uracil DNA glycosylase